MFLECKFEYAVECEAMSDGEYKTKEEALKAAKERWTEMCEAGDYEFGLGDATIYCIYADTDEVAMQGDYRVWSENHEVADGR